jgi:hypothetical protein
MDGDNICAVKKTKNSNPNIFSVLLTLNWFIFLLITVKSYKNNFIFDLAEDFYILA